MHFYLSLFLFSHNQTRHVMFFLVFQPCFFIDSFLCVFNSIQLVCISNSRELEQKRMLVERTCKEMLTFQQARQAWGDKQKCLVIAEEKEIEKQAQEQSDRSASMCVL